MTRDHDIDAEVTDLQTKMEMKTLYCNLNESVDVDLQKLAEYLTEQDADVVMFVAPTSVNGTDFKVWLDAYAAENGGLTVLESRNANNVLTMAALVKPQWLLETYNVTESSVINNAVLHFKANGIHFVVTELLPAKNAIPSDWLNQVNEMTTKKASAPLVYNPDNLAERKTELSYILKATVDNIAYINDLHWFFAINMNACSHHDLVSYSREFLRKDCYPPSRWL